MDINVLAARFTACFGLHGADGLRFFHSPGRVNLIGEHTDYNGGHVFPCALSLGTYAVIRKRNDGRIGLASGNFEQSCIVRLDSITYDSAHGWANYPKAVVAGMLEMGCAVGGFDLYIWGDLPNGAGLSSSASVELVTAAAVNTLFNSDLSPIERVKLCQRAENEFVGVNCGIMDQFASGMGRKGFAMLLDCATLAHQYVPIKMDDCRLIIANTNKRRGLAESKYNERRAECEQALTDLRTECDIASLCDLTPESFEQHKQVIKDKTAQNRAQHAVYENARTLEAVKALNEGKIDILGRLMKESHESLRDLYEVTGNELDALAEAAWHLPGVLGSRMTGAGFGGCTVSIVREEAVQNFIESVGNAYTARTGLEAQFYIAETGDGAREI